MSQEPATAHSYTALSLDHIIGLFLAQLYGWLIRCHESGAPFAPADIAQNVTKADALVHAFIRSRAAAQLEHAGYTGAARAMRNSTSMRASPLETPQLAITPTNVDPVTPEDLLVRLEAIISQFERADAIGSVLARIVVCTLLYISPGEISAPHNIRPDAGRSARPIGAVSEANRREIRRLRRPGLRPSTLMSLGRGPPFCLASIAKGKGKLFVSLCTTLSADPRLDLGSRPENQQRARFIGSGMVTSFRWCRRSINQTPTVRPGWAQMQQPTLA